MMTGMTGWIDLVTWRMTGGFCQEDSDDRMDQHDDRKETKDDVEDDRMTGWIDRMTWKTQRMMTGMMR